MASVKISRRLILTAAPIMLSLTACGDPCMDRHVLGARGGLQAPPHFGPKWEDSPTDMVGPVGIGQDDWSNDIYVVTSDSKLFSFTKDGLLNYWSNGGDKVTGCQHPFNSPADVASDGRRLLWVLDTGNIQTQVFPTFASRRFGHMNFPETWHDPDLAVASQLGAISDLAYIITAGGRLMFFTLPHPDFGADKGVIDSPETGGLWRGIAAVPESEKLFGLLWVPHRKIAKLIQIHRPDWLEYELEHKANFEDLDDPGPMSVNHKEQFFVLNQGTGVIHRYEREGWRSGTFGGSGSGPGEFSDASDLQAGVEGVYVADTGNNRIQRFDENGRFIAEWGGAGTG